MMPLWMTLAKGPAFLFVLTVLVLGLLRLVILTTWDIVTAIRRAGDRRLPYRQIALQPACGYSGCHAVLAQPPRHLASQRRSLVDRHRQTGSGHTDAGRNLRYQCPAAISAICVWLTAIE